MKNLQVALVQPNFKIGGGSFVGYWLPYSVGCLWSYASQYDWLQESFILKDIIFKREQPSNVVDRLQDCKVSRSQYFEFRLAIHSASRFQDFNILGFQDLKISRLN